MDETDDELKGLIWKGEIPVSQFGTNYDIPIPKPKTFGKTTFTVAFAESGALTNLQYAGTTGAGQMMNVVDSAIGEFHNKTTEEKAAQLKAEADLITQQQRVVKCKADPDNCE